MYYCWWEYKLMDRPRILHWPTSKLTYLPIIFSGADGWGRGMFFSLPLFSSKLFWYFKVHHSPFRRHSIVFCWHIFFTICQFRDSLLYFNPASSIEGIWDQVFKLCPFHPFNFFKDNVHLGSYIVNVAFHTLYFNYGHKIQLFRRLPNGLSHWSNQMLAAHGA